MYFELIVRFFIAPLLPKKDCEAQLGGFLNGLESPPRRLPRAPTVGSRTRHAELEPGNARATLQCLPGRRGFLVVSPGSRCCQKLKTMNECTSLPTLVRTRRCLTSSAQSTHRHSSTQSQRIWRRDSARVSRHAVCLHAISAPAWRNSPTFRTDAPAGAHFRKRSAGPGSSRVGVPRQDSLLHDET